MAKLIGEGTSRRRNISRAAKVVLGSLMIATGSTAAAEARSTEFAGGSAAPVPSAHSMQRHGKGKHTPRVVTEAGIIKQELIHGKDLSFAPNQSQFWLDTTGKSEQTTVAVTAPDEQVPDQTDYFALEQTQTGKLASLATIRVVQFPRYAFEDAFWGSDSEQLTSNTSQGVVKLGAHGLPTTTINLSNGTNERVNVGFTEPGAPNPADQGLTFVN